MKNNRGFTLIELMIVLAIIGILLAVAIHAYEKSQLRKNNPEMAKDIVTSSGARIYIDCIEGYKFITTSKGQTQQIFDDNKQGIKCKAVEKANIEVVDLKANPYNNK